MALTLNPEQVCSTLDSLKILAESTIAKLTGRLYALKRLAGLLELAGDMLTLPNPASLIPYNLIDVRAYEQLAQACPGLLPPIDPFNKEVNKLRQAVQDAYANLELQLEQHAYAKLAKLDSELSGMINQAAAAIANNISLPRLDKYDCLRAVCNAATVIPQVPQDLLLGVQNAIASGQSATITALTATQQQKVAQFQALKTTVSNLAASPTATTSTAATQAVASPTLTKYSTPTVASTGVVPTYRASAGGGGGGAAVSVGLVMPSGFTVTGSPVTGTGVLQVALGVSGILKGVSGVLLAAVPGVDYLATGGVLSTLAGLADAPGALTNNGAGVLTWSPGGGTGTVTQVSTGAGLTGGPITVSGTISVTGNLLTLFNLADATGWLHNVGGVLAWSTPTKSDVGLSSVENTALSTWAGSANLTTLGTVATGVWHGTAITDTYISSAATWNAKQAAYTILTTLGNLANAAGWLHDDGFGVLAWSTPSKTDVGLSNVTNVAQAAAGLATASGLTITSTRLLGRWDAGVGALEEVQIGTNLSLSPTGVLSAAGASATLDWRDIWLAE